MSNIFRQEWQRNCNTIRILVQNSFGEKQPQMSDEEKIYKLSTKRDSIHSLELTSGCLLKILKVVLMIRYWGLKP